MSKYRYGIKLFVDGEYRTFYSVESLCIGLQKFADKLKSEFAQRDLDAIIDTYLEEYLLMLQRNSGEQFLEDFE